MSLGNTVNHHKNGILLAYIANKIPNIHLRKLLKIIYLIDENFTIKRGFPLTWFDYYVWEKGPVSPEVYEVKNGAFSDYVSVSTNARGKKIINSVKPHEFLIYKEMGDFSQSEIKEVDLLLDLYKDKSADELSELTHTPNSIWSKVVNDNHISFRDNGGKTNFLLPLTLLFREEDPRVEIYEDAKWNMEFQAMLNAKHAKRNVPTS
ncbi:MAG: SocA family protein [Muribaculaceae bacterium]|nr:SocA family protein [Muribaculaceae bacterium]